MSNIETVEKLIGSTDKLVPNRTNHELLRKWAELKNIDNWDQMNCVELINLYHESHQKPSSLENFDIHEAIVKVLEAVNAPGFEVSLTRKIARAEMREEILFGLTTKQLIKETLEELAPRRIEIINKDNVVNLDGMHHYATENVVKIVAMNHPLMMVGPTGCGKTTIAATTANILNLPFYITSTINDPHQLIGFIDGNGRYHSTPFRSAFQYGGVWTADEIDAWDASAMLTANSALANGYCTFPDSDVPIMCHPNFRIVATANTYGNGANRVYVGRNELDAASLDRFAILYVDYDLNLERAFSNGNVKWLEHVWDVRKKINEKNIRHVASSRAISYGSTALLNGLKWSDVEEIYLFKGMSKSDREKLK